MYAILETVTDAVGIAFGDIHRFFVAGTFGACIHPPSAIALGTLPDLPRERYQSLGNSSLGGATRVLTSRADWDAVDLIRDRITYLELNVNPELLNRLNAACFLPQTDPARFPSVSPWP